MSSLNARVDDIKGLTPAIDPRRSQDFYALSTRNTTFDSQGPISAFGNVMLSPLAFPRPEYFQTAEIRVGSITRTFKFIDTAILEWDEAFGDYQVRFTLDRLPANNPYRWTYGYLNGSIFFCHPTAGLIYYDVRLNAIGFVRGPGVPAQPLACCIDNGRLCVIDDTAFYWSGQSNGFDFTPALGGAGFQRIADRVPGQAIMVTSFGGGCMTWTAGGIMRSEFTGDQEVYRHRALNTEYAPVNSFCVVKVDDDTTVILDKRGLFASKGTPPAPYALLFNEFLITELRQYSLLQLQNLRLDWDANRRFMFLSKSHSDIPPLYTQTYVLYAPLDKWGTFDEQHYGIGLVSIRSGTRVGLYGCFMDSRGRVRLWTGATSRHLPPNDSTSYSYRVVGDVPVREDRESSHIIMATVLRVCHLSEATMPGLSIGGGLAGFYNYNGGAPVTPVLTGLDAAIRIGLFRFSAGRYADEMAEVTDIAIGSALSAESGIVTTQAYDYVGYGLTITGTVDGLTVYTSEQPLQQSAATGSRFFTCSTVGIWMFLDFTALTAGEYYHLKNIELNGIPAGRYN